MIIELTMTALASGGLGGLIGRALSGRRSRSAAGPGPVCPCEHIISAHDDNAGRCRAQVERPHYLKSGHRSGHEYVSCACMRYSGPELISTAIAQEYVLRQLVTGEDA